MARRAWNKGVHTTTFLKNCLICNKEFRSKLRSKTKTYTRFCSNKCSGKNHLKPVYLECATCGMKFRTTPAHVKLGKKFCSRICHYTNTEWRKQQRETQLGENGSNWKGGITPLYKALRLSARYSEWRNDVFERDDYTCQNCGERGVELNADHIKRLAEHLDLAFTLSNGQTLCVPCHKKKTKIESSIYWKNQYSQDRRLNNGAGSG